MRRSRFCLFIAVVLSLALLCSCSAPELPPLPTLPPDPSEAPVTAADKAETTEQPQVMGVEPETVVTPAPVEFELAPEPTEQPLQPLSLNERYLDSHYFAPAEQAGQLVWTEYETTNYLNGETVVKPLTVYLPYGYDPARQYNVLFLLHTSGGDNNTWLVNPHYYTTPDGPIEVSAANILDNLIQERLCEPMIVVCPCGYLAAGDFYNGEVAYEQFDHEFTDDLMPFVAEHYATYATGGSHEELRAAREHFGVLGASFGAYMNLISIFATHMDLAANYCFVGGGAIDYGYLYERWSSRGYLDCTLHCVYIVEGEYDDRYGPESSYRNLLAYAGQFFNENNLHYSTIYGAGHEPRAWVNGLYNAAQIFFRDDPYPIPYEVS